MSKIKDLLTSVYITAVFYFIGAFIFWDFNAGNWTEFARFTLVIMWASAMIVWVTATFERET